jgi:uncharacterized phage protein (TIGR01671 family)
MDNCKTVNKNMREIKFRAWSKRDKCWCGAFSIQKDGLFTEMSGARMENGVCVAYADWIDLSEQDEIILMQYTGLKDKNGVEIYEGDILKGTLENHAVVDVNSYFGLTNYGLSSDYPMHLTGQEEREIIGNIYENPELLQ